MRLLLPDRAGKLLGAASPAKAVGVSTAVHAGGLLVMASLVAPWVHEAPRFSGRSRQVTLELAGVVFPTSPAVEMSLSLADDPVVITPREARLARRRLWEVPAFLLPPEPIEKVMADALAEGDISPHPDLSPPSRRGQETLTDTDFAVEMPAPKVPRQALASRAQAAGTDEDARPDFSANRPPPYPLLARQRGWEGTVLLRLHVAADGQVSHVEVARTSGHAVLDAAAANAVRNWRGEPARRGGVPVSSVELLPVRFQLR